MQSSGSFRLIVRRGPQPNQVYELSKDSLTIGRDISNEIVINDPEVSRNHCRFTRGPGGFTLEDLGSTNGTFVNGQRLTGARPLAPSDMIGLGETVTLGYEMATQAPPMDMPGQSAGTMYGQRPPQAPVQPPVYGAPQSYSPQDAGYPAQGAAQPAAAYDPYNPPPPPPAYSNYADQPPAGNPLARYIFLGCGCLILLCIVAAVIAVFIIDSQNLYCKLPVLRSIVNAIAPCPVIPAP
jgi:predicted component of type VI protein secretion system